MSKPKHVIASTRYGLIACIQLLMMATVIPGQYFAEALNVPMAPPGGGVAYVPLAADFNQNGYADLLYLHAGSAVFDVDLDPAISGVGVDFSQAYSTVGWGSNMHSAAADVNGDGMLDLIYDRLNPPAPTAFFSTIHVNIGNGNGTFVPASTASITLSIAEGLLHWFAMADVNNDGFPDVLTYSSGGNYAPTLSCYINQFPNWNLTWQVQVYATSGAVCVSGEGGAPRVGDFDGDGNMDLAVQHTDFGAGMSWTTNVLWGNGVGQFTAPSATSIPGFSLFPTLVIVGLVGAVDMNGDGVTDLISSVPTTVGGVPTVLFQVYLGSVARTLIPAGTFSAPPSTTWFTATIVADFNCDGFGDVLRGPRPNLSAFPLACNFGVTMALGLPGGQFHQTGMSSSHTPCPNSSYCPYTVVADFDGDSDPDLVCTPYYCPFYYFRNSALTGPGCSGSSPAPPVLLPGNAQLGNASFYTALYGALNNAPAVLAIAAGLGTSPINTCGVYLDLAGPVVFLPGVTDTNGNVFWPMPLPNNPAFHGVTFHAQAAVLDPLGPSMGGLNLALTPARAVIVW